MDFLPTLIGALPDLGIAGITLVVLWVGKKLLDSERAYFSAARTEYRKEAREDRDELKAEVKDLKAENRELEERLNAAWRQHPAGAPGAGALSG